MTPTMSILEEPLLTHDVPGTPASSALPGPRRAPASRRDAWGHVTGRVLLPLQAAWRGDRTRRYVARIEQLMALPPEQARRRTLLRLRHLLAYARATSPFWRRRMEEADFDPRGLKELSDLAALPILTRDDVGRHHAEMLSTACRGRTLIEGTSGGTTSEPVPFVQLAEAVWWKSATAQVFRARMGWHPGDRSAMLWGALQDHPPEETGGLRALKTSLIQNVVERILWLPADTLEAAVLDRYADALQRFRPVAMQAYPSAADLLARRLLETGRRLEIPVVLLTAEAVFPAQRQRIAEAMGAEVYSFYGAREVGWIADECRQEHQLHLNTPGVHVETMEDGRLLMTDLVDPAAPLFRYEVGDRGVLGTEPCPCGDPRPLLAELHGRALDVFRLPSGKVVPGVISDPRNWLMDTGIIEAQIIQHTPERFEVRYVPSAMFQPHHLDEFRIYLDRTFFGEATFAFERVERIEPEPNGKVRFCISHVRD